MQGRQLFVPSWGRMRVASPGDRDFASRVSGVLWLTAAATTLLGLALPGSEVDPLWVVWVVVGVGVAWGALLLVAPPFPRNPMASVHVSTVMGICAGVALVPVTGGTDSPALDYLWFVVVYAAFFYTPRQAIAYWLGCALVHARRCSTTATRPTATSRASCSSSPAARRALPAAARLHQPTA